MSNTDDKAQEKKASATKFILIGVIFALLIGGGLLYMNAGSVIKSTAEKVATQTLGVPVKIGKIDIYLTEKKIVITKLSIGNPKGYSKPHALTVGSIAIDADTISKEKLVFSDIATTDTNIYLEVKPEGTNLSTLANGVKKGDKKAAKETTPIKVVINKLNIKGSKLHPAITLAEGIGSDKTVDMPNIKLTGIGEKSGGVTAAEAISQILEHVVSVGMEASVKAGLLEGLSQEVLGDIGSSLGLGSISSSKELKNVTDKALSIFK